MKKACFIFLLSLWGAAVMAQNHEPRGVRFGGKVGFNSTFPVISSLTIGGVESPSVNQQYKVGYLASLFCRIPIHRFFIQPGLSWDRSESDILFTLPDDLLQTDLKSASPFVSEELRIKSTALEMPLLVGVNLLRSFPYSLSVQAGPQLKYRLTTDYLPARSLDSYRLIRQNSTLGVNLLTGVSFSLWRMFFDFSYEFGLNALETELRAKLPVLPSETPLQIESRVHRMSFSLGFLF